jgi:hypothetical protein
MRYLVVLKSGIKITINEPFVPNPTVSYPSP